MKVGFVGADVSKADQVRNMIAQTKSVRWTCAKPKLVTTETQGVDSVPPSLQTLGSVDILVNNAGIQHVSPVEDFPEDKWDAILAINLSSAFHATKAALPDMKKKGWGRIINIASVHGLVASAGKV